MFELILAISIAVVLNYFPKYGRIFKGFNTMIHESGHAFCSLLFSGEVISVDILYSGEGVAVTKSASWFSRFMISIIGYPFSSMVAFLFAYLIHHQRPDFILYFIISLAVINLFFWVRNVYGIVWLLVVITLISLTFYMKWTMVQHYAALGITALVFVDAYISSWHILYLSVRTPKSAGDARNLQQIAWLHASIWGLFFFLFANVAALMSVHLFHPISYLSQVQQNLLDLLPSWI